MDLIDEFVSRYVKEYDFYDRAARLVAQRLESDLRTSGIRCLVTSRAKDVSSLEQKCRRRVRSRAYETVEQISDGIVDLAGVRVALYFPGERDQVDASINKLFRLLELRRDFPMSKDDESDGDESDGDEYKTRFLGYSASHYRVKLREEELDDADRRYSVARVEIQVASVLMHAWSEVEHDLVYKPLEGILSEDEYALLDQLNGMVIAGEVALEVLQRAGERRVAESDRQFMNHFELAAHILDVATGLSEEPIGESGLGRIDLLFTFLQNLTIDTPSRLAPYLQAIHGNVELRPLAEQVVDALIAEDESRFEIYRNVQNEGRGSAAQEWDNQASYAQIGRFLFRWSELENLVREMAPKNELQDRIRPISHIVRELDVFDKSTLRDFDFLRRLRNSMVHGARLAEPTDLTEATELLESITQKIRDWLSRLTED